MSSDSNKMHSQPQLKLARQSVMAQTRIIQNLIPPTVSYTTQGNVLIIGPEDLTRLAAAQLSAMSSLVILANDPITSQDDEHLEKVMSACPQVESFYNRLHAIKGFLGQFQVVVENEAVGGEKTVQLSQVAIRKPHFDIVLDLSLEPCLNLEMLPPGYFYAGRDEAKLADALAQIPDLIGEFDKPRYVKVNSDICAHYRHGMNGCNRCLNFCPADAIASVDNVIEIDPYLCHGAGSCTNACPTGALSYDLPAPQSLHNYLQKLISRYLEQAGEAPVILFHDENVPAELVGDDLPGEILPVALEEITVAAIDHWMSVLAWGARQVLIYNTEATAPTLTQMLDGEVSLANAILDEMGQPQRITVVSDIHADALAASLDISCDWPVTVPGSFAASDKRGTLYQAIDHLNSQAAAIDTQLKLANIPYGTVNVAADNCTLCLSCVATCPTQALKDGGDEPALRFVEQDCVQCGLCEQACPEKVITITSQVNFDRASRQELRVLKEEPPFECIVCGTPFATQSMVHRMLDMVGEHSAFNANIERLKMCGDCRVKDLFEDILQDPEKQLR